MGLICIFHDAGHLDDVTYRSSESDAKRNLIQQPMLLFMLTVPKYPAPPRTNADHTLPAPAFLRSCRGLDLGQRLALLESPLLLQPHELEAVEVGERLAALLLKLLLGPVALLPLSIDPGLLPRTLDGGGAGTAGQLLDNEGCEESVGERDGRAGSGELGV